MLTETTLTLFNRHVDDFGYCTFYRSQMQCHWEEEVGKIVSQGSTVSAGLRSASAFVPHTCAPHGKTYVDHLLYAEGFDSPEDFDSHFTFAPEDIVYPYAVGDVDVLTSEEMKQLKKSHRDYFTIVESTNNAFGSVALRHWEFECQH